MGHVLVHYLHTGTYESLRPKPTDTMSKQICELKTSIQAYAAARAYDLPELMRLAEARIDKYGEGLPLPALLEVARDAYPTLTEGDNWFLDYLRSRIRPHLKDAKSLLGSNLLDQISGILSPHKVLLRTVLELFCERIVTHPEPLPASSPLTSPVTSPITSPGSSRAVSPFPPMSPTSFLEMRSRAVPREEFPLVRKRDTPWPSPDVLSEASWSQETSTEVPRSEMASPQFGATVMPQPQPQVQPQPFADLGPVILDVVPPPPEEAKVVVEPEAETTPEPEVKIAIEPEVKSEVEATPLSEPKTAVEVETKQEEEPIPEPVLAPVPQRERKDSGKGLELEPLPKELASVPEVVPELEPESKLRLPVQRRVLREVDSGFWEAPTEVEPARSLAPSIVELEPIPEPVAVPVPVPTLGSVHELESVTELKEAPGVDTRDFADSAIDIDGSKDKKADEPEAPKESTIAPLPAQGSSETAAEDPIKADAEESTTEPEPLPTKAEEELVKAPAEAAKAEIVVEIMAAEEIPEKDQSKEVEAQPETEKVEPLPRGPEQELALTVQQVQKETVESEEVAKPEPEPKADPSDPVHLPDDAQPAGPAESKAVEPSLGPRPEPAGKPEVQGTDSDAALDTAADSIATKSPEVLSPKPAPEQKSAKTEADSAPVEPCSAQVRQRSWKRRFLSLRYPAGALFGRGM